MTDVDVVLANRPGLGQIRLCGCNTIHLSLGPVTLAMQPEALHQAAGLIREALERMKEIADSRENVILNCGLGSASGLTH